jgi:hypothetical protein
MRVPANDRVPAASTKNACPARTRTLWSKCQPASVSKRSTSTSTMPPSGAGCDADCEGNRGAGRDVRRRGRNRGLRDLADDERKPIRPTRLAERRSHGRDVVDPVPTRARPHRHPTRVARRQMSATRSRRRGPPCGGLHVAQGSFGSHSQTKRNHLEVGRGADQWTGDRARLESVMARDPAPGAWPRCPSGRACG